MSSVGGTSAVSSSVVVELPSSDTESAGRTAPASWIGRPMRRVEDRRRVTGAGAYTDDVPLANSLYLAVLHSPYPHARITQLDLSAA
jgi:carbon-monoxide dehydrogenase large subunit